MAFGTNYILEIDAFSAFHIRKARATINHHVTKRFHIEGDLKTLGMSGGEGKGPGFQVKIV